MAGYAGDMETRRGYKIGEVISALQKSIRRSDVDGALYWAMECQKSGFGAWAWARLKIICSEDIGPAGAPGLAADVRALAENWKEGKSKQNGPDPLFLVHAVILLATSPKSRMTDWAVWRHQSDFAERREIPDVALDKHTGAGRRMKRDLQHFLDEGSKLIDWLTPEELKHGITHSHKLREYEDELVAQTQDIRDATEGKDPTARARLPHNPWAPEKGGKPAAPLIGTNTAGDGHGSTTHQLPGLE